MGFARAAEAPIRRARGKEPGERLGVGEKVGAATVGGALSCWNQPFEVSECAERRRWERVSADGVLAGD